MKEELKQENKISDTDKNNDIQIMDIREFKEIIVEAMLETYRACKSEPSQTGGGSESTPIGKCAVPENYSACAKCAFPVKLVEHSIQLNKICMWYVRDYWKKREAEKTLDFVQKTLLELEERLNGAMNNISEIAAYEFRQNCYFNYEPSKTE